MAILKPFRVICPKPEHITAVASNSSDFESEAELVNELHANPLSYLHVTKLPAKFPGKWKNPTDFLPDARRFIQELLDKGVIQMHAKMGFCVYRQTFNGASHTGVIGLCDMEDYRNNHIKRHEFTRHEREEFISALLDSTSVIGEPLLLSHHHKQSLEDLLRFIIHEQASVEFEKGGRMHQIWHVTDAETIKSLEQELSEIDDFYIMDGHHRIASIDQLYEKHGTDAYRYGLSFVLDANQLSIAPFHRLITDFELEHEVVLQMLADDFEINLVGDYILHPPSQRSFVLKLNSGTYMLNHLSSWAGLDVELLEEKVLKKVFNIQDTRSDNRLQFLPGDENLDDALNLIKQKTNALFLLHPCSFREIAMTSDAQKVLPPKSTFVEPKCRAGLFIQSFGHNPLLIP